MVLRAFRSGDETLPDGGEGGRASCPDRSFEESPDAQHANQNIEVVAAWIVAQVEHAINNPIFGNFAKRKLNEVMMNFERHLVSLGLGHEAIGAVLQQAYDRVRKLVSR